MPPAHALYIAPMLEALLFELEGVLVETHGVRRDALRAALADDHVTLPPPVFDACCAGLPVDAAAAAAVACLAATDAAARALDDTAVELAARRAERHAAARLAAGATLRPGAREALDALAGALRLGLVTRAARRETEAMLALAGLDAHFACVVTADDVRAPKPAADAHRAALDRLARRRPLAPRAVVAFEDAAPGVAAARAAGVRVVRIAAPGGASADAAPDDGADGRLASLRGLTPGSLAALLDLAPALR